LWKRIKKQTKFCSRSCSAIVNGKKRIVSDETKNKIRLKLTTSPKQKLCKICGQHKCVNIEICKHTLIWFNNLLPFGFDVKTIGTINVYNEFYRIKELILKEYYDNFLSPKDLALKYNYNLKSENLLHVLKSFNVKTRSHSEGSINACMLGKNNAIISNKKSKYQFKHGWHTTWNEKKIYYRSSYELRYAIELDNKKIDYEVEYFRIKYWDTNKFKYRVAIPDFYIPKDKKIVEVKSRVTFNKQNIIDKFKEYIKMGYIPYLYFEDNEYSFDMINGIPEYKFLI
jgi:hypothetical protein